MTPHEKHNAAYRLRIENKLDECQQSVEHLWKVDGYQTPWTALLRGNLQLDLGEYWAAHQWYELSWNMICPGGTVRPEAGRYFQDIALPYAYSRLRMGMWNPLTWQLFEIGRLGKSWHVAPNTKPWTGSADKMIVLSEGGFGDAFLFTRFFQKLDPIQRASSRLVMGPHFGSLKSFRAEWDGVPAVWPEDHFDWSTFRYSTALMSLMAVQGIKGPADVPAAQPYCPPPTFGIPELDNTDYFHRPPSMAISRGPRIGICWSAEENGAQKRIRSIDKVLELDTLAKWEFVNLCPGKDFGDTTWVQMPGLIDVDLSTWADTARVIAGLDCVVTVDSACAHLAGLLGVPTLLMLPVAVDWRWGIPPKEPVEDERSFWWPSVKLIRNTSPFTWRPALERVAAILEKL